MARDEIAALVERLRAREPYKLPLELMLEDIPAEQTIFLGQGDYPTVRQIVQAAVADMARAADALLAQQKRIAELEAALERTAPKPADAGQLEGRVSDARDEAAAFIIQFFLAIPWQDRADVFANVRYNGIFCCECGMGSEEDPNPNCHCCDDE